ncbi:MAG: tetratricopeptide repeat protein [Candidatus Binatia bacterium]|nr:tetratricopeptide repeat protein [Candidatus Binatia bacterium]
MRALHAWLLLGGATVAVYANTLDNGFVFDDYFMVVENEAIRLPPQEWWKIFAGEGRWVGSYRPLRTLSYAVDYQLGGLEPFIYHLFNLVYHWTAAFLVFLVTLRLLPAGAAPAATLPALGVALLWALHPVQTESVAYISGRRDILAGMFFVLAFYAFLRFRAARSGRARVGWVLLTGVAFLCAALAKESAFILPLVFFVYDYCREYDARGGIGHNLGRIAWQHRWLYGPLLALAGGAAWYYAPYWSVILAMQREAVVAVWTTVPRIWLHYVTVLLWPVTLNADYSNAFPLSSSVWEWRTLAATMGVVLLFGVAVWWLKRGYRLPAFGVLWFVVTLLPVSHLLPHPELVAEHYLYLPSFGFCLLVGSALLRTETGLQRELWAGGWRSRVGVGLCVVLLLGYAVRTVVRNGDWQDEITLWRKTVETAPTSARAHHNLAVALSLHGDLAAAEEAFRRALAADPTYGPAYTGLAELYLASFKFDDALTAAQKGVELRPGRVWARWVLGLVYYQRGDYRQALPALQKVVELKADFLPAHRLLVTLYRLLGEEEKALAWQQRFPQAVISLPEGLVPGGREGRGDS